MAQVLSLLPLQKDARLLVGSDTFDDAGVYKLDEKTALIQTLDFFTPIVDDPYMFGQIAAANSLSDIYAMGGKPLTAMNIVAFPVKTLDIAVLGEILKGGFDKVQEAGALMLGGHSVEDNEPKYGLSVTGIVHPDRIKTNSGSRRGDKLILTKPLGTGVISTALKGEIIGDEEAKEAITLMAELNAAAAQAAQDYNVSACTDVTGFGLLGHLYEMACAGKIGFHLDYTRIPFLSRVKELAEEGMVPGGAYRNRDYLKACVEIKPSVSELEALLLFDPQTSGGLLLSVPPDEAENLLRVLKEKGIGAELIGEAVNNPGKVVVSRN